MKKPLNILIRMLGALLICYAVHRVFELSIVSIIPPLAGILFFVFLPKKAELSAPVIRTAGIISAVLGLLTAFARYSVLAHSLFFINIIIVLICGLALGLALFPVISVLYMRLTNETQREYIRKHSFGIFALAFVVIGAVWSVFFLIFYPGIIGEDTFWQLAQGLGLDALSNHHPVAHTLIISFLYKTGLSVFGSANSAAAFLAVCQMVLLDLCWSFVVSRLYRLGFPSSLWVCSLVFYTIAPCNIVFSFSVHKDPWFVIAFSLFSAVLLEMICDSEVGRVRKTLRTLLLFVSALGIGLLRTNGKFVLIVLLPIVLTLYIKKHWEIPAVTAVAVVLSFVITGPVYNSMGVIPVDTVEYLSIPLQQISRVYTEGGTASEEDDRLIRQVIPVELIPDYYYPGISDNIKNLIREKGNQDLIDQNKLTYLGVWFRLLLRNPDAYIKAYVDQTVGFWYPDYSSGPPYHYKSTSNDLGIQNINLLPGRFSSVLVVWVDGTRSAPLLAYLYSNGLVSWLMILLLGIAILRKSTPRILFVPPFIYWLTLLVSTPVYSENRYMYPIFAFLPILFAAISKKASDSIISVPEKRSENPDEQQLVPQSEASYL